MGIKDTIWVRTNTKGENTEENGVSQVHFQPHLLLSLATASISW